MKFTRIFRLLAIAAVLAISILPATPALALASVTLSPKQGNIGDTITVRGSGFTPTTDTYEHWVDLYFTNDTDIVRGNYIDTDVTVYQKWRGFSQVDEDGDFTDTFVVPAELETGSVDVELGRTYYVLTTLYDNSYVQTVNSFTVAGGKITLEPKEGPVDTTVEITGASFSANSAFTIEVDGVAVPVKSGETRTGSTGTFAVTIAIPDSSAGSHTISAIIGSYEAAADFNVKPKAVMTPTSGAADTSVAAAGTGFARRKEVTVLFDKTSLTTVLTDANGSFNTTFTVPNLAPASYTVEFEDADKNLSSLKFTITGAAPPPTPTPMPTTPIASININPTRGTVGKDVMAGGAGFKEDATISVKWDDKEIASAKATQGTFVVTFKVPAGKSGDHTISVTDGAIIQKATFTVEPTIPPAPSVVGPEAGVETELPTFVWKEVTVDNPPATYTLQVATSQDFTASSIVLEKKGLASLEYTPTKQEMTLLPGRDAPYYWRVRATNANQTDGPWTGAAEFYITKPFTLPGWVKWVGLGAGVLVLLFIGYWLGRRSAWQY